MCTKYFIQATKSSEKLYCSFGELYFFPPKSFSTVFKIVETTDNTIAANIAGTQPLILTPGTIADTINKTTALTTKEKSPKVIIVNGAEIKLKIGLIKVFTTPKTMAASMAVVKFAT